MVPVPREGPPEKTPRKDPQKGAAVAGAHACPHTAWRNLPEGEALARGLRRLCLSSGRNGPWTSVGSALARAAPKTRRGGHIGPK